MLVVTPADQTVVNPTAFTEAMHRAIAQADQRSTVILGVTPTDPVTGYGYIRVNSHCEERSEVFIKLRECKFMLPVYGSDLRL